MALRSPGITAVAALAVVASLAPVPLRATEPLPLLAPGDRIRYGPAAITPSREAIVLETDLPPDGPERWLVRPPNGMPVWIDSAAVGRVDRFLEKGSSIKKGSLIGLLAGALVPVAFSLAIGCPECIGEAFFWFGPGAGAMGAGVGALVGSFFRLESWETVLRQPARPRVSVRPMRGSRGRGLGLGVTVAF